ncbi:hypothetical protein DYB32_003780 [Aphanomyces invadans]|uniref:Major facilitator superfamily (MFS) profile domain-containing protein n=1 Tax=Aphanomyces invadans TaxID=157072 RepID=A0A418AZN5_9STRA|nr:hypothetical protein DYB32_003780 [Aphanomyces invadans]
MLQFVRAIAAFRWKGQMIGYWLIYLSQGAFLGALGPALQEMSYQGNAVSSYNPAFAWHALGSILSAGFLSEVLVQACLSSFLGRTGLHIMLGTMSIALTAWYVCLPWVNQWGGSEWASCFFFVKGCVVAIVNVTINKCAAWTASGNEATTRHSYDPEANFIVLLVMIIATLYYGIQMGLAAFLFQYLEFVMALGYGANLHSICCGIMCMFWLSLALSYSLFTSCFFENMKSLGWLFFLNVLCVCTMAGVIFGQNLFGPEYVVAALTFHLVLFAVFISPLFTGTIQGLTNVVNPDLLARVSSLLVFGCFCGEAFIPVLMGFFMGDYSGSGFGAGTIVYITFALAITMMLTTGWFWSSVVAKQRSSTTEAASAAPSPVKPVK